jgi:hypothetical protein
MEQVRDGVVSPLNESGSAEERMLGVEMVREMVARRERGQGVKRIARELGVDRKTVKRWLKLGVWQPRQAQRRVRELDRFAEFLKQRAPEVGCNGAVLYRELQAMGFTGGRLQVQRFVRPYREQRKWSELATVRFETGPGEQAQVDYGRFGFGSARSWRRSTCSCLPWAIRAGFIPGAIRTNGWRPCSTATSARLVG